MRPWLLLAHSSAVCATATLLIEKKTLAREHAMEFSAALAFFNLILSVPFLFFVDYSRLQIIPLVYIFFLMILVAMAFLLIAKSIRHMEVSAVAPFLALTPAVTAIFAFMFFNEALDQIQLLGIALILIVAYVLELHSVHNLLDLFRFIIMSNICLFVFF